MSDAARPESARRLWAAVPFRGPVGSKRRLSGLLDASERERLSLAMLTDVLDVLLGSVRIERVLLLTPSMAGLDVPTHERLTVLVEPPEVDGDGETGGLNGALRHAQKVAEAGGVEGLLIVPADVPLIGRSDVDTILDAAVDVSVVIVPDRAADGTNALLLSPPTALGPSFGEASYARHIRLAHEADLRVCVVEREGLRLDLDTPADVAELLGRGHDGRAATLLRELRVERRFERFGPAQARSTTI